MSKTYRIGFVNSKTGETEAWIKENGERWYVTTEKSEAFIFHRAPGIFLQRAKMTASETNFAHTHDPQWVQTDEGVTNHLIT